MTIQASITLRNYTGNGTTKTFPVDLDCSDKAEYVVTVNSIEVPDSDLETRTTDSVTFKVAPVADAKIQIRRITPQTQNINYTKGGVLNAGELEGALDKLTKMIQEAGRGFKYDPVYSITDVTATVIANNGEYINNSQYMKQCFISTKQINVGVWLDVAFHYPQGTVFTTAMNLQIEDSNTFDLYPGQGITISTTSSPEWLQTNSVLPLIDVLKSMHV